MANANLILSRVSEEELAATELYHCHAESHLPFALALCLVFITFGVPGNLTTILALAWDKKVKNVTAIFIINLHISNLMICIIILPLTAAALAQNHWTYGKAMCVLYAHLRFMLATSSILSILAITITRFILVCFPFSYSKICNRKNVSIIILLIWVLSLTMYTPYYFGALSGFGLDANQGFCTIIYEKYGGILYLSFGYVLPIIILTICYINIWWTATKAKNKLRNKNLVRNNSTRSTFRPIFNNDSSRSGDSGMSTPKDETSVPGENRLEAAFKVAKKADRVKAPTKRDQRLFTMILAIIIAYSFVQLPINLSYCINPIIYVFMSKEYRQAYSNLFRMIMHKLQRNSHHFR
ncbi:hypothetical protein HW555_001529 [Spodoptera exigua]|uniref:G-protein coupled receptors family 1 profile domain-containing protein n=1 Tax=Spodoptera exigua TaxID=7107 RepID=A0A835GS14_SPOEX|nr:hypothetical protein HW555_001529 [Spodoptera exigua]